MKKRFAKTVALVVAAALTAGAPVSVMAAEEQSETVAVQDDVTWNAAAQRR